MLAADGLSILSNRGAVVRDFRFDDGVRAVLQASDQLALQALHVIDGCLHVCGVDNWCVVLQYGVHSGVVVVCVVVKM
mgnify:CR=1 FL=1